MRLFTDTYCNGSITGIVTAHWFMDEGTMPPYESGYALVLYGRCINLITLVYECTKAVRYLKIQKALTDGDIDEPYHDLYTVGVMVEEIAAELQRNGFYWGCKIAPGSVFNRTQLLALHAPGTPDIVLENDCPTD